MKNNYIAGNRVHIDVPNVFPEGQVSLVEYEHYIKRCDDCFKNYRELCYSKCIYVRSMAHSSV